MARAGKAIERELVDDGLGVGDLYDHVLTKAELEDVVAGRRRSLTPRRFVAVLFEIMRARQRHGLRPYPQTSVNGVAWIVARDH